MRFHDASEEAIDVIVYATGFKIAFPFIDRKHLNWQNGHPCIYLMNLFDPQYDNLFLAGLIQPESGAWGLIDYQTQLVAKFILGQKGGSKAAETLRRPKATHLADLGRGIRYLKSERHLLGVEHFSYRRRVQKLLRMFK